MYNELNKTITKEISPVRQTYLYIDGTMISKFGRKFENVSRLFDHAAHNGSNNLNGNCFVSLMLCVPVWNKDKGSGSTEGGALCLKN